MKIIYQFFEMGQGLEFTTVFSTVALFLSFAGIVTYAFLLNKSHTKEMSEAPLDKDIC